MSDRPGVLDLFAGAGGMALGFQAEGWRCIGAVEVDQPAADTFRSMFAVDEPRIFGGPEDGDVHNLPVPYLASRLPEVPALIVGGPPCQGFSRAGLAKQASLLDEEDKVRLGGEYRPNRNDLYRYFLRVVRYIRPMAFVMENVPGLRDTQDNDIARRIAREAASSGYNVRYFLLNAVWYGVPQSRHRLFFVGLRSDLGPRAIPRPPVRTYHNESSQNDFLAYPEDPWMLAEKDIPLISSPRPAVTVFDAIGDLPRLKDHLPPPDGRGLAFQDRPLPLRHRSSEYVRRLQQWPGFPAPEQVTGNWYRWNPRDFPIFAEMAQGDTYPRALEIAHRRFQGRLRELQTTGDAPPPGTDAYEALLQDFVPPYADDKFHEKWRKLVMDRPSWTITAHLSRDTYSHIHYDSVQARTITVREAARLQSFPDAFQFSGNHGDRFRQVGNAVPPLLARAVARELRQQLQELGALPGESAVA